MRITLFAALCGAGLACAAPAAAQQLYVGGSVGYLNQQDSDNSGRTGAFSTGNGAPTVPNNTAVAAGTPYGWTTEFEDGYTVSAEVGFQYDSGLRSGLELVYSDAEVDRHQGVQLAGTRLDGVDAAVLTGSDTALGVTVGDVVAKDDGKVENLALFANLYYDFNRDGAVRPYVGAGIGVSRVDVVYRPSGVGIVDEDETKFAYQVKAGASWSVNDAWDIYGEYAYRATEDVETNNRLFPGSLDIENRQHAVSVGARYRMR